MTRKMKDSGVEWIGMIPDGWNIISFKHLYNTANVGESIDKNLTSETDVGTVFYTAGLKPIYTRYNEFPDWKYTNNNDLLLARNGTPYVYLPTVGAAYSDHIIRTDIKSQYSKEFVRYCLQQSIRSEIVDTVSISTWSISLWNVQRLSMPSLAEQRRIVGYLDAKCASIDDVIAKTNESIEEYKKLKQAVITEAVTKGVRDKRPMKDSGSVWFGKIPSDWNMLKFKHVVHIRKDIAGKDGLTVLSITQRGIVPKDLSKNEGQLASDYSNYQLVDVGDFAMNHMDLLTGWVDISKYNGVTSPDYRVFVLNDSRVSYAKYYLYLVQMCYMDKIFYSLGQGVSGFGRWRLPADQFLNFWVAAPSFEEQQEIADYLDSKCAAIDTLISKKQQFIDELTAYKKSLIYEYVTGKKEVPA